ncbi:MAG: Ig domain-containing protein [Christensenellales bacterium]
MKTFLKQVCSLILALLMVLSVVSVPTFSAKAEDGENPPSTMTLNEALNVEGGNIEFINSGDYIDSENGNYIWRVEDDHIASPEVDRYEKKAIITAEVIAAEGDIVSFDFICNVSSASYVSGGLLFSIDDISPESGKGYGYAGFYDWTHKEYALTAGKHTLKWVFCLSTGATGSIAKLDNVFVGEPVHPSQVILQDTVEVGVNCRTQLTCEVLPAEAFNKNVSFSSSDENVAAVLDDGTVIGVSAGRAVITASTVDGGHTDTCEVNVIDTGKISSELFIYNETYVYDKRFYHTSLYKFTSSLPEFTELVADLSDDELNGYTITACAYVVCRESRNRS